MSQVKSYQVEQKERIEIIQEISTELQKEDKILFAFVHGSFCSETFFRDIDIGIFVHSMESSNYLNCGIELSQKVESTLQFSYPIEVKVINEAPLSFCFHVIQGELVFTRDEDFLTSYMMLIAREYLDAAPLRFWYIQEAMK